MEESLAYTLINLFAEFGGYLGIFMGVSILSLYDMIIYPIHKAFKLYWSASKEIFARKSLHEEKDAFFAKKNLNLHV